MGGAAVSSLMAESHSWLLSCLRKGTLVNCHSKSPHLGSWDKSELAFTRVQLRELAQLTSREETETQRSEVLPKVPEQPSSAGPVGFAVLSSLPQPCPHLRTWLGQGQPYRAGQGCALTVDPGHPDKQDSELGVDGARDEGGPAEDGKEARACSSEPRRGVLCFLRCKVGPGQEQTKRGRGPWVSADWLATTLAGDLALGYT